MQSTRRTHAKLDLALANTRARLRMTSLYYLAGLHGLLVAGTGNKVEDFGVGFYTKYGDGGVDLSPIADLLKSEVYELATYLKLMIQYKKQHLQMVYLAIAELMKIKLELLMMN